MRSTRSRLRGGRRGEAAFILGVVVSATAALAGPPSNGSTYSLLWSDDFNGTTLDPLKWGYNYSWGNALNHDAYLDASQDTVANGIFTMTAVNQRDPAAPDTTTNSGVTYPLNYTSGGANTSGKLGFTSGYVEASMEMPSALGTWPAFWSLFTGWPPEIDIMEVPNTGTSNTTDTNNHVTIHYTGSSGAASAGTTYTTPNLSTGFHTYGLDWTPTYMTFYFDGVAKYTTTDPTIISQMQTEYLILNLAVGGWGGTPAAGSYPAGFKVDYVKVWQTATPQATTWTLAGNGNWNTAGNWSNGSPQLASSTATFATTSAGAANVSWSNSLTTGAVVLTGTTNYTLGGTTADAEGLMLAVNSGSALVKGDATNGQGTHVINARLELNANTIFHNDLTNPITINGSVIGTGTMTIEAGKFIFASANNAWTGATTINAGATMQIGNAGANASFSTANVSNVANSGTLVINTTSAFALSNTIVGPGGVTQAGTGTTTLSGQNSYTGLTQITGGTLLVTRTHTGGGAYTIGANGTLGGTGTIGAAVALQSGGTLAPGVGSTPGTLIIGNLSTTGGGTLPFQLGNTTTPGGVANDLLKVNGGLALGGTTTVTVAATNGALVSGTYNLVSYSGALTGGAGNLSLTMPASVRPTLALDTSTAQQINLIVTGSAAGLTWVGDGTANAWNAVGAANWLNGASGDQFYNWDTVNFTDSGSATVPIALAGTLSPGAVVVNSGQNYTFSGSGTLAGMGGLSKSGTGTLVINTTNAYTGATVINGGIVSVAKVADTGTNSALGAGGNIVLDGGTLKYTGGTGSSNRPLVLGSGGGTIDGSGTAAVALTNSAAVGTNNEAGTRTLTLTGSVGGTLAGVLVNGTSGATGLTKTGTGTWTLTGNSTYTGPTNVSAGTLILASSSAVTGAIGASSAITIFNGGTVKLAAPAAPPAGMSTGVSYGLGGTSGMFPGITINQGGTLTTNTGICALLGPVTLAGGTLASGTANSTSGSWDMQSNVTVSGGTQTSTISASDFILAAPSGTTTFNVSSVVSGGVDLNVTGFFSGLGNLAKSGNGVMQISGLSTYTGSTTINAGTLQFGSGGRIYNAGNISAVITLNAATLVINNWSYGPTDGGNLGGDNFNPTDLLINGGTIQYTGSTNSTTDHDAMGRGFTIGATGATLQTMTAGVTWNIDLYTAGTADTSFGLTSNGGTLTLTGVGNGNIQKAIPGTGGVTKMGTGTWTLSGSNTYTGSTQVSAGTLAVVSGAVVLGNRLLVGQNAGDNGIFNMTGGTGSFTGGFSDVGNAGTGVVNLSGTGVLNFTHGFGFNMGDNAGSNGTLNINGGTINLLASTAMYVGKSGTAVGVVNQNSGTVTGTGVIDLILASSATSSGTYDLNGGNLTLNAIEAGPGASTFKFNGGTLHANGSTTAFMQGVANAIISTGAANIDTQANAITIAQPLLHDTGLSGNDGGLDKLGAGTLTLTGSNSYTGATQIAAGTLNVGTDAALGAAASAVKFVGNSTLQAGGNLVLNGSRGVVVSGGVTGTVDDQGNQVTINGVISGAGNFTKAGTGTIYLTNANTLSGTLNAGTGTLELDQTNALQSSTVNLNGGAVAFGAGIGSFTLGGLTGAGNLVLADTGAGAVALQVGNGNTAVTYSGALSGAGGSVTKVGTAAWTLTGANTYSGGTTVSGGQLIIGNSAALPAQTAVTITGGTLRLPASMGQPFVPSALVFGGTAASPTGTLDLKNNDAILPGANTTDEVRQLLLSGYAGGAWTGTGIGTLSPPAGQGLGYLSAADYALFNPSGVLDGVTLAGTETVVKYTYQGDANLDGQITASDYAMLDASMLLGTANPTWLNGDFNYDGVVDYRDYALIDFAYENQSGGVLAGPMIAEHAAMFGEPYLNALAAAGQTAVPEPGALGILGLGVVGILRRRGRANS